MSYGWVCHLADAAVGPAVHFDAKGSPPVRQGFYQNSGSALKDPVVSALPTGALGYPRKLFVSWYDGTTKRVTGQPYGCSEGN